MKRLSSFLAACVLASLIACPSPVEAQPVHSAQVVLSGSEIHYSAALNAHLTGWGGPVAITDARWGYAAGWASLSAQCILGLAQNVYYDATSGTLSFDCLSIGIGQDTPNGPFVSGPSYIALIFGNVRVSVAAGGASATVTALNNPLAIAFSARPGGWYDLWSGYNLVCFDLPDCSLTVT